jgi:hypothetical protein
VTVDAIHVEFLIANSNVGHNLKNTIGLRRRTERGFGHLTHAK